MPMPRFLAAESHLWPALAVALVALVIGVHAWPVIAGAGEVIYGYSGDNWKNIYTFAYHVLHDPSAAGTQALHWPYGEHVAMSDAQPLLSNALRPLASLGLVGERALTALVLYLPLLSFPLSTLAVYAVLREVGLARVWAAAWSVPTVLLQGQNYRYFAHYALGYSWVIPLLLWLWLRARRRDYAWPASLWVGVSLLACSLLHLYYLGVGGALLLGLLGFDILLHARRAGHWKRVGLAVVLQVLSPAVLTIAITRVPDPFADRIGQPYGLFEYRGYPLDWLLDYRLPHWAWFGEHVWRYGGPVGDPMSYLGLAVILGALALLLRSARRRWREGPAVPARWPERSRVLVLTALALAIFSFGFPLAVRGEVWDTLRESAGPLKQLRALRRFGWAAYYPLVVAVVTSLTFWLGSRRTAPVRWAPAALAVAIAVSAVEGILTLTHYRPPMTPHVMYAQRDSLRAALDTVTAPVAAVLPIPFFSVGSEDFVVPEVGNGLYTGTYPSLATGRPNVGLYMSRTSLTETLETVPLSRGWWNVPRVLERTGTRHILVSVDRASWEQAWVRETYQSLYDRTREVYHSDMVSIRLLDSEDLPAIVRARRADYIARYFGNVDLRDLTGPTVFDADGRVGGGLPFERIDLDDIGTVEGLDGGRGVVLTEVSRPITQVHLPNAFEAGEPISVGAHFRLDGQGQILALLEVDYLGADGAVLGSIGYHPIHHWQEVFDRWVYMEAPITPPAGTTRLRFRARAGRPTREVGGVLDEITLRRPGTHYAYPLAGGGYVVNGRIWAPLAGTPGN